MDSVDMYVVAKGTFIALCKSSKDKEYQISIQSFYEILAACIKYEEYLFSYDFRAQFYI